MSKFALLKFLVCTVKALNFDINEIFKKNQWHIRVQFEKLFEMSYILGKLENMSFSTFFRISSLVRFGVLFPHRSYTWREMGGRTCSERTSSNQKCLWRSK